MICVHCGAAFVFWVDTAVWLCYLYMGDSGGVGS